MTITSLCTLAMKSLGTEERPSELLVKPENISSLSFTLNITSCDCTLIDGEQRNRNDFNFEGKVFTENELTLQKLRSFM